MAGPVDPREVEEMSRLRRILAGEKVEEQSSALFQKPSLAAPGSDVDPTDDMQRILDIFNQGATASVQRIKEEAKESRPLRDALLTEKTTQGVKIGSWEIKVTEEGGIKTYDVTNVHTGEAIAHDLTLYESALCLTKLLNFHVGINSAQVREVLELEDRYARYRQEAALFRHRMKQRIESGDHVRAAVAEDRYNQARTAALDLREQIITKSKSL